ncbi:MAG: hypothetical protein V1862_07830 [Methanobacteriota archaeon]
MKRLFIFLIIAGLIFFSPAIANEETNSTDPYVVREYSLISFTEEIPSVNLVNTTPEEMAGNVSVNQTRRGGEMTAKKLFQLKQAAKEGLDKVGIQRDDLLSNTSDVYTDTSSQNCVSGVCKKKTGYGTFA